MRTHAQNASLWLVLALMVTGMWAWQGTVQGGEHVAKLTGQLSLGKPIAVENVTIWPVYSSVPVPEGQVEYITLPHAQKIKTAHVREIGAPANRNARQQPATQPVPEAQRQDQGGAQRAQVQQAIDQVRNIQMAQGANNEPAGRVNQLVIENTGKRAILVLAGTLVKGGKQDRQIAQDFIIPPGKTVPVDAFCVEQGRWTAHREGKATNGVFEAQKVLAVKEVRNSGQFKNNQSEVWAKVATANAIAGNAPQTGTLFATMEENDRAAQERRERIRKGIADGLSKLSEAPFGLAYAVDGEVREIRVFNDPRILKHYEESLIGTIVVEADLGQRKAQKEGREVFKGDVDAKEVVEVVKQAEKNREESIKTQAGNENVYRKGKAYSASMNFATPEDREKNKQPVSQSWSKH